jgi:hypothetical protein
MEKPNFSLNLTLEAAAIGHLRARKFSRCDAHAKLFAAQVKCAVIHQSYAVESSVKHRHNVP